MSIKNGYHYSDDYRRYYRNEDGSKIPEFVCLCFAHEPSECCCDCTGWGNHGYNDDVECHDPLTSYEIWKQTDEKAYE